MEDRELVSRFAAFCGPERFRTFVLWLNRECPGKGRLLFWQEELWAAFVAKHPGEVPLSFEGISEALRLCPVHDLPLQSEEVPVVYGLVHFPEGYIRARDERFPFANEVVHGGCCVGCQERAAVLFCEACRREQRDWAGVEART